MNQRNAELRACASCEWIFKKQDDNALCPKCGFVSYGARYAYGKKCYRFSRTQEPWLKKKLTNYTLKLLDEIYASQQTRKKRLKDMEATWKRRPQ